MHTIATPREEECLELTRARLWMKLDCYWQMEFMDENWEILYLEEIQQILESVMDRRHPNFQLMIGLFNQEPKGEKEACGDVLSQVEEAVRYGGVGSQEKFLSAMTSWHQ